MNGKSVSASAILGITLACGIVLGGYLLSRALYEVRAADRFVTVKGLAEQIVDADLAVWPLTIKETDNELAALEKKLESSRRVIREFLLQAGFEEDALSEVPPQITDFQAESYYQGRNERPYRYMAQTTITLRSTDIVRVKKAMRQAQNLISKGVVLTAQNYPNQTEFLFTGLNSIKPAMVAEATRNARQAAEQFAKDSGSKVGSIRRATQGLFSIRDRDRNTPDKKKVRVVTTVEYYLED